MTSPKLKELREKLDSELTFDYTIANVLIPVNALLIAVFAGWVISRTELLEELSSDALAHIHVLIIVGKQDQINR